MSKQREKWEGGDGEVEEGEMGMELNISSLLPIFATSQGKEASVHLSGHGFCCRPFVCVSPFLEGTHM